VRYMAAYSVTKYPLCFICHGKPDKGQDDFDCGCRRPDSAFLSENKCTSHQSKICLNTYSKALLRMLYTLSRCIGFSQQLWRGSSALDTDRTYTPTIITDIAD